MHADAVSHFRPDIVAHFAPQPHSPAPTRMMLNKVFNLCRASDASIIFGIMPRSGLTFSFGGQKMSSISQSAMVGATSAGGRRPVGISRGNGTFVNILAAKPARRHNVARDMINQAPGIRFDVRNRAIAWHFRRHQAARRLRSPGRPSRYVLFRRPREIVMAITCVGHLIRIIMRQALLRTEIISEVISSSRRGQRRAIASPVAVVIADNTCSSNNSSAGSPPIRYSRMR